MDIHKNARLTLRSREALVEIVARGSQFSRAAASFHVTPKTAAKWFRRYQSEGPAGLQDRSSRPHRSPRATSSSQQVQVLELRRQHRPAYTDNGSSYRSHRFHRVCCDLGLKHRRTRPYSPQTNGKAERFIQTALREWAYATHWPDSQQRNLALAPWTDYYNFERPHGSLQYQPPISRSETGTTS